MQDIVPPPGFRRGNFHIPPRNEGVLPRPAIPSVPQRLIDDVRVVETTKVVEVERVAYAPQPVESIAVPQASPAVVPYFEKTTTTEQTVISQVQGAKKPRHWFTVKRSLLIGAAVVVLGVTGYVTFDTWNTNNNVRAESGASAATTDTAHSGDTTAVEGSDKSDLPKDSLANYQVSQDLPRALYISKLNVAARILPMGVNNNGSVQAPININDSGWYNGSVKPGDIGAMFIDGHSSGSTHQGLFGNLDKLTEGDTLQVEKGDGTKLTYKVVHTEVVDLDKVDMKKMLLPYGNALRGLNLMTCTGQWTDDNTTMNQRILIFTEQVS